MSDEENHKFNIYIPDYGWRGARIAFATTASATSEVYSTYYMIDCLF